MVNFEFKGRIHEIGELKEGTSQKGKDWKRIDFVCSVRTDRFEDFVAVSASNAMADVIKDCDIDEEIAVKGYIYAREYNGRYYNNHEVTDVERAKAGTPAKGNGKSVDDEIDEIFK